MKTQLIFLVVCVVAAFAFPGRSNVDDNNEITEQYNDETELELDHQGATNADDESIDNQNAIPSNETATEKGKCNWLRRRQNENRIRLSKYGRQGRRCRNSTKVDNDERRHPFIHTSIWQEKQDGPMPDANADVDARRHRHHRHHHHHHNCTTTTPPPTTTSSTTPVSEIEE